MIINQLNEFFYKIFMVIFIKCLWQKGRINGIFVSSSKTKKINTKKNNSVEQLEIRVV